MKQTKSALLFFILLLVVPVGNLVNAQNPVNWTPEIFANGQSYITTFQHNEKNLSYYTSVEQAEIEGAMVTATVVRFAPNILNNPAPSPSTTGVKVMRNVFDHSQTIDLTGEPNGDKIVIEIYEDDIDLNDPSTIGNPKGKGTLVSSSPPQGGAGG